MSRRWRHNRENRPASIRANVGAVIVAGSVDQVIGKLEGLATEARLNNDVVLMHTYLQGAEHYIRQRMEAAS